MTENIIKRPVYLLIWMLGFFYEVKKKGTDYMEATSVRLYRNPISANWTACQNFMKFGIRSSLQDVPELA